MLNFRWGGKTGVSVFHLENLKMIKKSCKKNMEKTHAFFSKGITCFWMEQLDETNKSQFSNGKNTSWTHLQRNTKTSLFNISSFRFLQPPFWSKELGKEAMTCTLCSARKSGKVSCPGSSNTWESRRFLESFVSCRQFFIWTLHSLKLAAWKTPVE